MTATSASSARTKAGSSQKRKDSFFLQLSIVNVKRNTPEKFDYRYYCITMKVFQDYIIKGSWIAQKNLIIDSNFGHLCMKKGRSFQKKGFSFFSVVNGGGG